MGVGRRSAHCRTWAWARESEEFVVLLSKGRSNRSMAYSASLDYLNPGIMMGSTLVQSLFARLSLTTAALWVPAQMYSAKLLGAVHFQLAQYWGFNHCVPSRT